MGTGKYFLRHSPCYIYIKCFLLTWLGMKEGWLAANAVDEEDKITADGGRGTEEGPDDPMQGLEGLDVAGPKAR